MAALVHGWSVNTATRVAGVAARSAVASTQAWRGLASSSSSSSSDSDAASTPQLTHATLNPRVRNARYAVRGAIVDRALKHAADLSAGKQKPFDSLLYCNIGNPQSLQQKPITFNRQVMSLLEFPGLIEQDSAGLFPADVKQRASALLEGLEGGGLGAYSHSQGVTCVRKSVAKFIEERDGYAANPDNIFLTDGASPAVQRILMSLIRDHNDSIMIPIPQYPLYTGTIALFGGSYGSYYLEETDSWGLNMDALKQSVAAERASGKNVRALVVINPGNPTGTSLTEDQIKQVLEFCHQENLVMLADEVYQPNIWDESRPFHSFKKVACDLGLGDDPNMQLASMHSVSKGFLGECGHRGGYMEVLNFEAEVRAELYKLASLSLCSNVAGQVMVELMVNPPKPGDASYELYASERDGILASLQRRAVKLVAALGKLEGVTCEQAQGAMYVFPRVRLPQRAIKAADEAGIAADAFYCMELLDATGIVVVPGSGFGQVDGTYHFRATILPPEDAVDAVVERLAAFHASFMDRFRD